jgi:hypothetical protein
MSTRDELIARLRDEADLCRNETADDIAGLLDEAANAIAALVAERDAAIAALQELTLAEGHYRLIFQTAPSAGHLDVGRAWDRMKRAGDKARMILDAARAAQEPCAHVWKVTHSGVTYHDCRCDKCGEYKRESWD